MSERAGDPAVALDAGAPLDELLTGDVDPFEGASPFPPIADYGFLSDCEVNALVAPSGNVEWMCLPRHGPTGRACSARCSTARPARRMPSGRVSRA